MSRPTMNRSSTQASTATIQTPTTQASTATSQASTATSRAATATTQVPITPTIQSSITQSDTTEGQLDQLLTGLESSERWNLYKILATQYEKDFKNLAAVSELIFSTVGPRFKIYLFEEHDPRKLLQILTRVAKPSKARLRQIY